MTEITHENVAEVGDLIRAWDFEPDERRPDRYIEGVVVSKEAFSYTIIGNRDVYGEEEIEDKHSRVGYETIVPFEVFFGEFEGRVVNLTKTPEM